MAKKKTTCTKETSQKLLITTSSDDHRITRPHTLNVSLIQPEFNIDICQSLHVATPIYMLGTFLFPPLWCAIHHLQHQREPLHFRRKRSLASSLASEGRWRLSNSHRNVEIILIQIIIKLLASGFDRAWESIKLLGLNNFGWKVLLFNSI